MNTHYIKQTLAGPICTRCKTKVVNGGSTFFASYNSIKRHFLKNKCFDNDIPNINKLVKELESEIHAIISRVKNNPEIIEQLFQEDLSSIKITTYCSRCGFCSRNRVLMNHINSKKSRCTQENIKRGPVITNSNNVSLPTSILDQMRLGTYRLPRNSNNVNILSPMHPQHPPQTPLLDNHTVRRSRIGTHNTIMRAHIVTPLALESTYQVTNIENDGDTTLVPQTEINTVSKANYTPKSIGEYASAVDILESIKTHDGNSTSFSHVSTFKHILRGDVRNIHSILTEMATKQKSPYNAATDNHSLVLLLDGGERWMTSESANMDVIYLTAKIRSKLYNVGDVTVTEEEDIVGGKTFVPTNDVSASLKEYTYLIKLMCRMKWAGMRTYLEQVDELYNQVSLNIDENDEQAIQSEVINRMVDTSIIPSMLIAVLLEDAPFPNGPNFIADHLAARSVKVNVDGIVVIRSPNNISRGVNALLRVFRHGVCSFLNIHARAMKNDNKSSMEFDTYATDLLSRVQSCLSTDLICNRIRTAREIDRKNPTIISKQHDPETLEILIEGISIPRVNWSRAISSAIDYVEHHFRRLFPD